MFPRLLALVDDSPFGARALPYASWLAAATRGEVLLLRAITADERREDVEWDLAREVGRLRRRGLLARALVGQREGRRVADELLAVQQAYQAKLIILATHGGRGPGRTLWGATADEVLRLAPVPVLLVPKHAPPAWPRRRPLRVLLSPARAGALEPPPALVDCLASITTIQLVLTAMAPADDRGPHVDTAPAAPTVLDPLRQRLDALACRERAAGIETSVRGAVNGAAPCLADVARAEHSDLIVLAASSRDDAMLALFGANAGDARCRLPMPLLLARPADPAPT